ncbi:MAG: TolC family protein [Candidatus Eremiobacteraeota bacterium]|nr:TolC family protein [Candidatus Eremiobacteraeota bacterium]MBV8499491.1 TolC family protein [Candidatus Eremiobacteraeota bacterium]
MNRFALVVASAVIALAALPVQPTSAQLDRAPQRATLPTEVPSPRLPVVPSVAPGYRAPDEQPSQPQIVGVTQQPFVGMSLQDAIAMALLKNPDLAVSASNVRIARYTIVEAKGAYDVQLQLKPSSSFSVNPPQNAFEAGPGELGKYSPGPASTPGVIYTTGPGNIIQHESAFQYGVGGQTENGMTYQAGIQQSRTYNNTVFDAYNPYYIATLNLAVTQPLLRNAGMNANKRQLKLAFVNEDAKAAQALIDASNTIAQVEDAYWQLVAAWRNVAIQEEALREAIAQQQNNVRLARRGAGANVDAVESQTQVETFRDDVYSALQNVSELQNHLKSLVVTDAGDPIWRANLVPSTSVQQLPAPSDLAAVIAEGRQNRPEVLQARAKAHQADVDQAFAKNQSLPQADLRAQYLSNGFAGLLTPVPPFLTNVCSNSALTACPTPPPQTQGAMAFAYHNMWAAYFPTFNVALIVGYPLQANLARGMRGVSAEERRQATILMQGVAVRIGAEARVALQSYESALARLNSARRSREAAETVYASELRRFHAGASTTFLVLQRQVQLAQARGQELQAQTDLNQAIVELHRVDGSILTDNGVNLKTLGSQAIGR